MGENVGGVDFEEIEDGLQVVSVSGGCVIAVRGYGRVAGTAVVGYDDCVVLGQDRRNGVPTELE